MNSESSASLVFLWDRAQGERPGRQAILFLTRLTGLKLEEAEACSVGERDAHLLRIRKNLFGGEAQALTDCPECGEAVEFTFQPDTLLLEPPGPPQAEYAFGDYKVAFRLPTAQDAALACSAKGIGPAEDFLLRRCLLKVQRGDDWIAPDQYRLLPDDLQDFVSAMMEQSDPQAATEFQINCPACGYVWAEMFDAVSFLWAEIADLAARIFREVRDLSRYYGWAESEILNMHPARRRMYLTMAEA